jgi:predicted nucleic acid-binding protein
MPHALAVSDTSCLISLNNIQRLDILESLLGGKLLIPDAVALEWGMAIPSWMMVRQVQDRQAVQSLMSRIGLENPK